MSQRRIYMSLSLLLVFAKGIMQVRAGISIMGARAPSSDISEKDVQDSELEKESYIVIVGRGGAASVLYVAISSWLRKLDSCISSMRAFPYLRLLVKCLLGNEKSILVMTPCIDFSSVYGISI